MKMAMNVSALSGVAAVCCAGIFGCKVGEVEKDVAPCSVEADAAVSSSDSSAVSEKSVAAVREWVKPYQAKMPFVVENDGKQVYIRGTVGLFPSVFSKFDIVVNLDGENGAAYCYGYLPTVASAERRAETVEFLFRAECGYGLSPATLVLTDDGTIRCQSWCPLSELEKSPEKALPRLIGSVIEKLYACSQPVAMVILGTAGPEIAANVTPVEFFKREAVDAKADTATVLKACFSDSEYTTSAPQDDWFSRRFGNGEESTGLINARVEEVKRDLGGIYDELCYTLIVKDNAVDNICVMPLDVPAEKIAAVADAAMRLNQSLNHGLFGVDFENGKLWSRFSIPVPALTGDPESKKTNFNLVAVKLVTVSAVAKNSELFSAVVQEESTRTGDAPAQ